MRPLSLVCLALAMSTGTNAVPPQIISSAIKATISTQSDVSSRSVVTKNSLSTVNLGDFINTPVNNTGTSTNNTITRKIGKVDTIDSTAGIPTTAQVHAAKYTGLCKTDSKKAKFCKNLQSIVSVCIDRRIACEENTTRTLLYNIVDAKPCDWTMEGDLVNTICIRWWNEANRCKNAGKRPCSTGHVNYLLRELRDFLGLKMGN